MSKKWMYFDVDDTLVLWENVLDPDPDEYPIYLDKYNLRVRGRPHLGHIRLLRRHKMYGKHTIVVWSAGGEEHAREMVRQLGIGDCVDYVLAKPDYYYDDLRATEFMGERRYIKPGRHQ